MNDGLNDYVPIVKIVVIGVGGAGNNAVNRMIDDNISSVDFYVMNTDKQALSISKAPNRIILGEEITGGLGAGGNPEIGKKAAEASLDRIKDIVKDAQMVFIAAGMGGGTGTGAAPVIAAAAKAAGALTVGIVTRPFSFEGQKKLNFSVDGLNALKEASDAVIVVSNDKLLMNAGNLPVGQAFSEADKVLSQSVKTVADLVLMPAIINLDFKDVESILKDSGLALIGFGSGEGERRSEDAALSAINGPLLEQSIKGSRRAICHITCGTEVNLFECQDCFEKIINQCGGKMELKYGIAINDQLNDQILVSIIAGDFDVEPDFKEVPVTNNGLEEFFARRELMKNNPVQNKEEDNSTKEENKDADDDMDDIIPGFLSRE